MGLFSFGRGGFWLIQIENASNLYERCMSTEKTQVLFIIYRLHSCMVQLWADQSWGYKIENNLQNIDSYICRPQIPLPVQLLHFKHSLIHENILIFDIKTLTIWFFKFNYKFLGIYNTHFKGSIYFLTNSLSKFALLLFTKLWDSRMSPLFL